MIETVDEIIAKCEALGHQMVLDSVFGLSGTTRYSCTSKACSRAVLKASGGDNWYGSALVVPCAVFSEVSDV